MKHTIKLMAFILTAGLAGLFAQPVITTEPMADTVTETESAQFTVAATLDSGVLTYQWQESTDDVTFTDVVNDTLDTMNIASAALADSGKYYRVVVTDSAGSDTSVSVQLIVNAITAPVVDTDPMDTTVTVGSAASFTGAASGTSVTLQWQKDSLGDDNWVDIAGETAASYNIATTALEDDGSMYRLVATNGGGADTSAAATLTVNAAPTYGDWTSSAQVTINTGAGGAALAATDTIMNYPLLVRLDGGLFDFSGINGDGSDLRFTDKDGVPLAFEIEVWDTANAVGAIWVKIPMIVGDAMDSITMYWGNDTATTLSNPSAVFDTTNGFISVYHLNDGTDVTGTGNTGTLNGSAAAASGLIGSGMSLGSGDNVQVSGFTNLPDSTLTVCAWINLESMGNWTRIVTHDWGGAGSWLLYLNNSGSLFFGIQSNGNRGEAADPVALGEWAYTCGSHDLMTPMAYLNGEMGTNVDTTTQALDVDGNVDIGGTVDHLIGLVDEVRISNVVRSPAWIKLNYETQKPGQMTVSSPRYDGCVKNFMTSDTTISVNEGEEVTLSGTALCADSYMWEIVEGDSTIPSNLTTSVFNYTVGRITADSSFTLRFSAMYTGVKDSVDVTVNIIEAIPDPIFTLAGLGAVWDGNEDVQMTPFVSNMSAILASPAPYNMVNYAWTTSGITVSKTGTTTSTMTMTRAYGDGTFEVRLCLDNGGEPVCDTVNVDVLRPVSVRNLDNIKNPIVFENGSLSWYKHAMIQIWDLDGSLLFEETGRPGKRVLLQPNIVNGFENKRYYVRITDFDKIQ